jgi:hypothetical protein
MTSYRFARRSFMQAVGGAFGLKVMLRNMEASAQGMTSPPRVLVTHWPVGTVRPDFIPNPTTSNTASPILKPFGDAGLGPDMSVLMGLSVAALTSPMGGGHEAGTVKVMTAASAPGTRGGEPEQDDAYSGAPSFDQVLLKNATILQRPGAGYANAICDSRVDFLETSTQCLSYGYATQPVAAAPSGTGTEHVPLLPILRPLDLYTSLFNGFMAGGGTGGNNAAMMKALLEKKSVLDFALRELNQIRTLAPASEAGKIDIHAQSIRDIEAQISAQLTNGGMPMPGCTVPAAPPAISGGKDDRKSHNDYNNPATSTSDDVTHAMIGSLHMGILKAAFVCDIIRVATFQWSPGTNHVAFKGQFPGEAATIYMHHPLSHRIGTADTLVTSGRKPEVQFLSNIQTWYNTQMAALLSDWKKTTDSFGGNLFDHTIIPYVTEVAATGHDWNNMPAILFGGKALGFQHGQYLNLGGNRPYGDLWVTMAQAFGLSPTTAPLNAEIFAKNKNGWSGPIAGLWTQPA